MKKMKRLAALFLAVVMVMAMGMTAFAAPETDTPPTCTLKINAAAGHTYKVYQLLVGDLSSDGKTLSNIKIGASSDGVKTIDQIKEAVTNKTIDAEGKEVATNKTGIELSNAAAALVEGMEPVAEVTAILGNEATIGVQEVKIDGSSEIPTGYYVITDEYADRTRPADVETTLSATMVWLAGDLTVEPKDSDVPEQPGKSVDDTQRTVSIGDTVTYTLNGKIPDMSNYEHYKYVLVDTLCKGLEPKTVVDVETDAENNPLEVPINNEEKTFTVVLKKDGADPVEATFKVSGVQKDAATGKTEVRFALVNAIDYAKCAGYTFEFDYKALVTADADFEANSTKVELENRVKVEFPNDPDKVQDGDDFGDDEPKGETVETIETVYSAKFVINKVKSDGTTEEILPYEAEFELKGTSKNVGYVTGQKYVENAQGEWYGLQSGSFTKTEPNDNTRDKYVYKDEQPVRYALENVNEKTEGNVGNVSARAFVDGKGVVSFTGLGEGIYTITEVTTPDGYNTIEPIEIEIIFNEDTKTFSAYEYDEEKSEAGYEGVDPINMSAYKIVNQAGALLPSTGGIGTTIFYVVGGILVVGAGVLLITKKRMSAREK